MVVVSYHLDVGKWVKRCRDSRGGGEALADFYGFPATVCGSGELLRSLPKSLDGCLVMGDGSGGAWWWQSGGLVVEDERKTLERESGF